MLLSYQAEIASNTYSEKPLWSLRHQVLLENVFIIICKLVPPPPQGCEGAAREPEDKASEANRPISPILIL